MDMQNIYLLFFDFDGTIARAFEKSPEGIGVLEAYKLSVKDMFGKYGLEIYEKIGNIEGKFPLESVMLMLEKDNSGALMETAKNFILREKNNL